MGKYIREVLLMLLIIKTGKAEVFNDVNENNVNEHYRKLEEVKRLDSSNRIDVINSIRT